MPQKIEIGFFLPQMTITQQSNYPSIKFTCIGIKKKEANVTSRKHFNLKKTQNELTNV